MIMMMIIITMMKTVEATHNPIYMVRVSVLSTSWASEKKQKQLEMMFMKHYVPNPLLVKN